MKLPSINNIPLSYIQSVVKIDASSPSGLTWLYRKDMPNRWNTRFANKPAGCKSTNSDAYQKWGIKITYKGKQKGLQASRVVFLLQNEYLTKGKEVDHIDGNSLNNNPLNLRETNRFQNSYNSKLRKNNTSGHKGICWYAAKSKWVVRIRKNGKNHFLGLFVNKEDAIKTSIEARKKLHGDFGRDK
jgi:hypothetical protein